MKRIIIAVVIMAGALAAYVTAQDAPSPDAFWGSGADPVKRYFHNGSIVYGETTDFLSDLTTFVHANSTVQAAVRAAGAEGKKRFLVAAGAIEPADDADAVPTFADQYAKFKALLNETPLTQAAKDAIAADMKASFQEHYATEEIK